MSDEKSKQEIVEEQGQELSQADNIVLGMASHYMKPFSIVLHCEPDTDNNIVKVTLKESYEDVE